MQRPRGLEIVEPLGRPLAETIGKHQAGNFGAKSVGYTGIEHGGSCQGRTWRMPCKIDAEMLQRSGSQRRGVSRLSS